VGIELIFEISSPTGQSSVLSGKPMLDLFIPALIASQKAWVPALRARELAR
jgi:hypothetical protein